MISVRPSEMVALAARAIHLRPSRAFAADNGGLKQLWSESSRFRGRLNLQKDFAMKIRTAALGVVASISLIGAALAQTAPAPAPSMTPPAATAPAPAAKAAKAPKAAQQPRTPESIACSAKADEAGLKGKAKNKERRAFRKKCMAEMKPAAAAMPAPAAPMAPTAPPAKKN